MSTENTQHDKQTHHSFLTSVFLGLLLSLSLNANADHDQYPGAHNLVIFGYDPVAYFTIGEAKEGSKEFSTRWLGGDWHFVNQEHLDMFVADPQKYMPQYGGYCSASYTYGVDADPRSWQIVEGKLYLFYNVANEDGWDIGLSSVRGQDNVWENVKAGLEQEAAPE